MKKYILCAFIFFSAEVYSSRVFSLSQFFRSHFLLHEVVKDLPSRSDLFFQIPVMRQGSNAECGFHALKNALVLLDVVNGARSDVSKKLAQATDTSFFESLKSEWMSYFKRVYGDAFAHSFEGVFPEDFYGDSAGRTGILEELAQGMHGPSWAKVYIPHISVLNSLVTSDFLSAEFFARIPLKEMIPLLKYMNLPVKKTPPHVFILGHGLHWIAVLVQTVHGKKEFVIADSFYPDALKMLSRDLEHLFELLDADPYEIGCHYVKAIVFDQLEATADIVIDAFNGALQEGKAFDWKETFDPRTYGKDFAEGSPTVIDGIIEQLNVGRRFIMESGLYRSTLYVHEYRPQFQKVMEKLQLFGSLWDDAADQTGLRPGRRFSHLVLV